MTHTTEWKGYEVIETIGGLDVYDDTGDFACQLNGMSLADYTYDGKISDAELEQAIDDEIETENFIDYQKEYC